MNKDEIAAVLDGVEESNGKKYARFSHTWEDPWEGKETTVSARFARPTKEQLKRMQNKAIKDSHGASYNLILDVVHNDDREKLLADLAAYPGIVSTFGVALIKAMGISADLGN